MNDTRNTAFNQILYFKNVFLSNEKDLNEAVNCLLSCLINLINLRCTAVVWTDYMIVSTEFNAKITASLYGH